MFMISPIILPAERHWLFPPTKVSPRASTHSSWNLLSCHYSRTMPVKTSPLNSPNYHYQPPSKQTCKSVCAISSSSAKSTLEIPQNVSLLDTSSSLSPSVSCRSLESNLSLPSNSDINVNPKNWINSSLGLSLVIPREKTRCGRRLRVGLE